MCEIKGKLLCIFSFILPSVASRHLFAQQTERTNLGVESITVMTVLLTPLKQRPLTHECFEEKLLSSLQMRP